MEINIQVEGQRLRIESNYKRLVYGTRKFIKFIFDFSDDWDGLTIFAQFVQDGEDRNVFLDADGSVYLPSDIKPGRCDMILYGTGNGDIIATSNLLAFLIDDNHVIIDESSIGITPSLYEQLVAKVNEVTNSVATVAEVKSFLEI